MDSHAQWEIQQFGKVMAGMLKRVAPLAYEAWIDYEVCGARFSRMEMEALRALIYRHEDLVGTKDGLIVLAHDLLKSMVSREVEEFLNQFDRDDLPSGRIVPDFELDLSLARDASFFEAQAVAAVKSPGK